MRNIAIINAIGLSSYAFQVICGGQNTFDRVRAYAQSLPECDRTVVISDTETPHPSVESLVKSEWNTKNLFHALRELTDGFENMFYVYADCPFLDGMLAANMYRNHARYMADYTFADGFPYGLTPEILKTEMLGALQQLVPEDDEPVSRTTIFDVIRRDINSFDIETEIAPRDQRLLRVSLTADSRRNMLLLERIVSHGGVFDSEGICEVLESNADILRTLPAYVLIQVTEGSVDKCVYDPGLARAGVGESRQMSPSLFLSVLTAISETCEDAVVGLSIWGEPALHPRVLDLVAAVAAHSRLKLVVETSGKGWDRSALFRVLSDSERPPHWIVFLDAVTERTYETIRGSGFREAVSFAEELVARFPDRTYVQATRMRENEDELERFFREWKKKSQNVIIQKYNHYCGQLEDRRVTDLSPMKRFPCWHLKRDLYVTVDGTVPLCSQDLGCTTVLGNLLTDDLPTVWERGTQHYAEHLAGNYLEMCKVCDEYYTYNF